MLAGMESFRTHVVLLEREDGLPYLRIIDLTRAATSALEGSYRIGIAEPAYNATLGANPEFDTNQVRFHYESFITPRSVYDYDLRTGERILRKQQPVLGGYDPTEYGSARLHALAPFDLSEREIGGQPETDPSTRGPFGNAPRAPTSIFVID
jgi:oligopeptidase B